MRKGGEQFKQKKKILKLDGLKSLLTPEFDAFGADNPMCKLGRKEITYLSAAHSAKVHN